MIAPAVRTFGKYLLDEEIARGGMSRVYLARLRGLGGFEKKLVVKQVLPELASDPRFVSMFVQEAKTLVQMSHPHIAPVYELGVVDGVYFLAMEHVDGGTLSQILEAGPLAPELVAHMGAQICDALHYAHERFDIIHRDVTPRNVIVDTVGHARLLDFGIAAPVSDEEGALFGTPGYLSPEQAAGDALDARSDVFALGAVLFEALTARRAFFARNVEEAREVLTMEGPDLLDEDEVPEALAAIVEKALARDPDERWPSARELGRALRSWVAAHAPEGVGPELAERARSVETAAPLEAELPDEVEDEPTHESEVKTLATSRLLDEMLGPVATPIVDPEAREDDEEPSGTTRIERESDEPGTERIERPSQERVLEAEDTEGADDLDEEEGDEEEDEPVEDDEDDYLVDEHAEDLVRRAVEPRELRGGTSPGTRLVLWVAAALVMASVAFAVWPRDEPEPLSEPTVDAPPEVETPTNVGEPPGEDPPVEDPPVADPPVANSPVDATPVDDPPVDDPESGAEPSGEQRTGPTAPPGGRARLNANGTPWANITLDGRDRGNAALRDESIRAGRHVLRFHNPTLREDPVPVTIDAEPGQTVTVVVDLSASPPDISISRRP